MHILLLRSFCAPKAEEINNASNMHGCAGTIRASRRRDSKYHLRWFFVIPTNFISAGTISNLIRIVRTTLLTLFQDNTNFN